MTGKEFKAAIKAAGYKQSEFAELMGVRRDTIARRYTMDEVEPYWAFALTGVVARDAAAKPSLSDQIVKMVGSI